MAESENRRLHAEYIARMKAREAKQTVPSIPDGVMNVLDFSGKVPEGTPMVQTDFGDILPTEPVRERSQPQVSMSGDPMATTDFGDVLAPVPAPTPAELDRNELLSEIDREYKRLYQIYQNNLPQWNRERDAATPMFRNVHARVMDPIMYTPSAQKDIESALTELRIAWNKLNTYTQKQLETDRKTNSQRSRGRQFIDGFLDQDIADVVTLGWDEVGRKLRQTRALEKSTKGESLTDSEKALLLSVEIGHKADRYLMEQGGKTSWGNIGTGVSKSIPVMIEVATTGGTGGVVKLGTNAAQKGTKALIKRGLLKTGEMAANSALQTPLMHTAYATFANSTKDQYHVVRNNNTEELSAVKDAPTSPVERIWKAFVSGFTEVFSERLGRIFPSGANIGTFVKRYAPKTLGKTVGGLLAEGIRKLETPSIRQINQWMSKVPGYNGTWGELGEELAGDIIEPVLTGELERIPENFSKENLWQTVMVVAITGGMMETVRFPVAVADGVRSKQLRREAQEQLDKIADPTVREEVRKVMDATDNEERIRRLTRIDWKGIDRNDAIASVKYVELSSQSDFCAGAEEALEQELAKMQQTTEQKQTQVEADSQSEQPTSSPTALKTELPPVGSVYFRQQGDFMIGQFRPMLQQELKTQGWTQIFNQFANQDNERVQIAIDGQGTSYFVRSGSLDGTGADATVFVQNAKTGAIEQRSAEELTLQQEFDLDGYIQMRNEQELAKMQQTAGQKQTQVQAAPTTEQTLATAPIQEGEIVHTPTETATETIPQGEGRDKLPNENPQIEATDQATGQTDPYAGIQPVGRNRWGEVFQWAKGRAREAVDFLTRRRNGYLRGVFQHPVLGDIDLTWGNEQAGLRHIEQKHVIEMDDFETLDQAIDVIGDVVENGDVLIQKNGNYQLTKENYVVAIARSEDGNWVITAFDKSRQQAEKKRDRPGTTRLHQSTAHEANGELVSPRSVSASEDSHPAANAQEGEQNIPRRGEETTAAERLTKPVQNVTGQTDPYAGIQPVGKGLFGNIYDQFRGKAQEAVDFLLSRREGEAIGALYHPQVGDIDLVWGEEGTARSDGYGLSKIAKYHPEVLADLQEIVSGMIITKASGNRLQLESQSHMASVRLDWDGEKKTWLLTAFEKETPTPLDRTTDVGENLNDLQNDTAPLQSDGVSNRLSLGSEGYLTETPTKEGSDLVPTSDNPNSPDKNMDFGPNVQEGEPIDLNALAGQTVVLTDGEQVFVDRVYTNRNGNVEIDAVPIDPSTGQLLTNEKGEEAHTLLDARSIVTPKQQQQAQTQSQENVQEVTPAVPEQNLTQEMQAAEQPAQNVTGQTVTIDEKTVAEQPDVLSQIGRSLTSQEANEMIRQMQQLAVPAPELELTPDNWIAEFGEDGIINTPIGEVKQGDNQYLKLAQQGRNGKLGMVKPTLENPAIILEDTRLAKDGKSERDMSYIFVKPFAKEDGSRYYYFTSVTVSKDGREVVISSQERSANRISKLLQQGKVAWIDSAFSLYPTTQVEGSVLLNDSNRPTTTDNQPALLGINSSEHSSDKGKDSGPNVQEREQNIPRRGEGTTTAMSPDLVREAATPTEKLQAVGHIVDEMNRTSGASAYVFNTMDELPEELRNKLGKEIEHDGITWKGESYICSTQMRDEEQTRRTYIHEVAGHQALGRHLSNREQLALSEAIIEDIGLEHMRSLGIEELNEEIDRYESIDRTDARETAIATLVLGREYIAYSTERFFSPEMFGSITEPVFSVDLSQSVTDETIARIIRAANTPYHGRPNVTITGNRKNRTGDSLRSARVAERRDVAGGVRQRGHTDLSRQNETGMEVPGSVDPVQGGSEVGQTAAGGNESGTGTDSRAVSGQDERGVDRAEPGIVPAGETVAESPVGDSDAVPLSPEEINERFNGELQRQIDGTLSAGHVYQLGRPGDALRAAGIPTKDGAPETVDTAPVLVTPDMHRRALGTITVREQSDPNANDNFIQHYDIDGRPSGVYGIYDVEADVLSEPVSFGLDEFSFRAENWDELGQMYNEYKASHPNVRSWIDDEGGAQFRDINDALEFKRFVDTQKDSKTADLVREAATPTEKLQAVGHIVDEMNRTSGASAYVFNTMDELPEELRNKLGKEIEHDGITWKGESYICSTQMRDEEQTRRTYIHEVAGHQNIEQAIATAAEKGALWEAIVDDIGLDELRAWGISELIGEINEYEISEEYKKWQLGREVLAYATELNADLPYFTREKPLSLTVDLNQRITPETLRAILETANRYDDQRPRIVITNPGRERVLQTDDDVAASDGRGYNRRSGSARAENTGDNISGDETIDSAGRFQGAVRSVGTGNPEHSRAVSGQDERGVDRAEPGIVPTGETVAERDESSESDDIRYRRGWIENSEENEEEIRSIIESAQADGTYLKAPNGESTRLSERQWAQVRTQAFKNWFGDWEKTARIDKLRHSEPLVFSGDEYKGKYELNNRSAATYINNELRGEYLNQDTNTPIRITRKGAFKVTRHDAENTVHLQSVAYIPQMLEKAVYIDEAVDEKSKAGFDSYRYYVCGLKIGGIDYTAKLVIGQKNGETYYDHALTEIEKADLIERRDEISSSFTNNEAALSKIKDKRLLRLLQTDSSKIVDENGEPLVVYHGTDARFTRFDPKEMREREGSFFFAENREDAESYSDGTVMPVFIDVRNPFDYENGTVPDEYRTRWEKTQNKREQVEILKALGFDGWTADFEQGKGWGEVSAFRPAQIKSATDNTGMFSAENDDIRFRNREAENTARLSPEEINERFNGELQRQIDGTLPAGHVYQLGRPGDALRAAGIPNLPIELSATRLAEKANPEYASNHPFALEEVANLPRALAEPIAVFDSKTQPNSKVVLTELQHDGNNFVAVLRVRKSDDVRKLDIEVNSIRSLYPKDRVGGIINWINNGLLRWVDKEKAAEFISTQGPSYLAGGENPGGNPFDWQGKQQSNSADVAIPIKGTDVSAKIIENFENPTRLDGEKTSAVQELADELGVPVRVVRSAAEIDESERDSRRKRGAAGWYDRQRGEIAVVLSNCSDAAEVQRTVLHEAVAHYGLPELLGRERADELFRKVFDSVKDTRRGRELLAEHGSATVAGEEYLATMAEGNVTPRVFRRMVAAVRAFFRDVLGCDLKFTDADMRYILWRSKHNLQRARTVGEAMEVIEQDIRMRKETARESARERKAERLDKLRQSEPIRVDETEHLLNRTEAKTWLKENFRGDYTNIDTGETITLSNVGINEVTSHGMTHAEHLRSLAAIPQMIERSVFIDELSNVKGNDKYTAYRYYVCGLKIGETDYTAKIVVGVKDGKRYYDHRLTQIEKGALIDNLNRLSNSVAENQDSPVSGIKDKRLVSVLQAEPLAYQEAPAETGPKTAGSYLDRISRESSEQEESEIRFRKERETETEGPIRTTKKNIATRMGRKFQDAQIPVRQLQDYVREHGGTVDIDTDVYSALNRAYGRQTERIRRTDEEFRHLGKRLGEIGRKWGFGYQSIERYLSAKSSQERQASGLSAYSERADTAWNRAEVEGIIAQFEAVVPKETVEALWAEIRKLTRRQLDMLREYGLITAQTYRDILARGWQYYLPLQGIDFEAADMADPHDLFGDALHTGRGAGMGSLLHRATGRTTKAGDVLSTLQQNLHRTILSGEQNLAKLFLLRLVEQNPQLQGDTRTGRAKFDSGEAVRMVNERFNGELQRQIDGTLPAGHVYRLGRPNSVLLSTGIPNLPIELSATRLAEKAAQRNHEFELSDVSGLPEALQTPVAIFAYGDRNKAQNVIVELERDGKKFVVGLYLNQTRDGIEVNSIRGLFPKTNSEWLNWITQGKMLYADKGKIQALIDKQRTNLADVEYLDLDSAAKIVENFENPTRAEVKNGADRLTRSDEGRTLEWTNEAFNRTIERLTPENADRTILGLGDPSPVLLSAGIENKPIKLHGNKVVKKMKKHGFALDELRNLPAAVADPIAVFRNKDRKGNRAILTELQTTNGNLLVTIDLGNGPDANLNIVSSVFGKADDSIVNWFRQGLATYINKEKALAFLDNHPAPIAGNAANPGLSLATNIIKNFTNPTLPKTKKRGAGIFEVEEQWFVRREDSRITDEERARGEIYEQTLRTPPKEEIERSEEARREMKRLEQELHTVEKELGTFDRIHGDSDRLAELQDKRIEIERQLDEAFDRITVLRTPPPKLTYRGLSTEEERRYEVPIYRNGIRTVVRLSDPNAAQAVNGDFEGLFKGAFKKVVDFNGRFTRWNAATNTSWNPEFQLKNKVRDSLWAGFYSWVDREGSLKGYLRNFGPAHTSIVRYHTGLARPLTLNERAGYNLYTAEGRMKATEQYGAERVRDSLYDDFLMEGGLTGRAYADDTKTYIRKMKRRIRVANRSAGQAFHAAASGLDMLNDLSEVSTRFATFLSQMEQGRDVREAVNYARDITINFNRSGEWGRDLNSLYMFFGASMQALDTVYKLGRRNKARMGFAMAAVAGLGYGLNLLLNQWLAAMADGEEDDEEWFVSDYVRNTNICLPGWLVGSKDRVVKIPLPQELRPAWVLGTVTADMTQGRIRADEGWNRVATAVNSVLDASGESYLPVEVQAKHPIKTGVPSNLHPLYELEVNEDFMGRPIFREALRGQTIPESQLGRRNTLIAFKAVCEWLNELGGGSATVPAGMNDRGEVNRWLNWLDINPSKMEHLFLGYTGGVGRLLVRTWRCIAEPGDELRANDIPFINAFVSEVERGENPSVRYYDLKEKLEMLDDVYRRSEREGGFPAYYPSQEEAQRARTRDRKWLLELRKTDRQVEKLLKLRDETKTGSPEYKTITKEMNALRKEFLERYDRGTPGD